MPADAFDDDSVRRIGASVRFTEQQQGNWTGRRRRTPIFDDSGGGFWALINGYTAIGTSGSGGAQSNQWSYSWAEQQYVSKGKFQNLPGGRSSGANGVAYNSREANNSSGGTQGNSINVSDLGPSQNILPVQGSPVVWMRAVITCNPTGSGSGGGGGSGSGAGNTEYEFEYENAVGPCSGS